MSLTEAEAREILSASVGHLIRDRGSISDAQWNAIKEAFSFEFMSKPPVELPEEMNLTHVSDESIIESKVLGIVYATTDRAWNGCLDRERLAGLRALVDRYSAYPKLRIAAQRLLNAAYSDCDVSELTRCIANLRTEIEKGPEA